MSKGFGVLQLWAPMSKGFGVLQLWGPMSKGDSRMTTMTRRELLKASATAGLVLSAPALLSAQSKEPIPIGTLCPLTGAGGSYGPDMQRSVVAVVERINKAGGIHGRPIQLFHEDDQTSAEAGVRAARKLIDVNKVVAIVSTWASAVTLAVKPLCVEAKVFVIGVSGADSVTQGDHKGYIARTQPNTNLQGRMYAKFAASKKEWKRVAYMALQPPQAWDQMTLVALALAAAKGEASGTAIKDHLRAVSNPPGTVVYSFADGAKLLGEGKKINYEGASGSCDFDQIGDILSAPFSVQQVRKGKSELVMIINP